jgi:hypothetical protein
MMIAVYVVSVLLAVACISLFAEAMRRMFSRHEGRPPCSTGTTARRLQQTLNDAIRTAGPDSGRDRRAEGPAAAASTRSSTAT